MSDEEDDGDTVGSVLRGFLAIRKRDPVTRYLVMVICYFGRVIWYLLKVRQSPRLNVIKMKRAELCLKIILKQGSRSARSSPQSMT